MNQEATTPRKRYDEPFKRSAIQHWRTSGKSTALGALELSGLSTTVPMDSFGTVGPGDWEMAGLYLNNLTLDPGSLLIISNNVELYFQSINGVTSVGLGVLGAGDNILILNGGSFHQLTVIPEPSILMLLTVGAFAILKYRRRSGRKQK